MWTHRPMLPRLSTWSSIRFPLRTAGIFLSSRNGAAAMIRGPLPPSTRRIFPEWKRLWLGSPAGASDVVSPNETTAACVALLSAETCQHHHQPARQALSCGSHLGRSCVPTSTPPFYICSLPTPSYVLDCAIGAFHEAPLRPPPGNCTSQARHEAFLLFLLDPCCAYG